MTSAFGLNGVALIHMLGERQVPILFVNTGLMFPETLELRDKVARERLVLTYLPEEYPFPCAGLDLSKMEPCAAMDNGSVARCCGARKLAPMRKALKEFAPDAVITPRGRFQSVTRQGLCLVERDRYPVRVNPLAHWSQEQVEQYIRDHGVAYNPLYDQGYYSVGCWPCTRAVENGEDVRAGRWDKLGRVECGLWT
jgi:phosphoadenosine phosphosulfate reductase